MSNNSLVELYLPLLLTRHYLSKRHSSVLCKFIGSLIYITFVREKKRCEKTKGVNRCDYRHIPMYTFYIHTESVIVKDFTTDNL